VGSATARHIIAAVDEQAAWPSPRAQEIFFRLAESHGEPVWDRRGGDALEELVGTILSQHTSDVNSERAYASLRARFPTWREVLESDQDALVESIRSGGLAPTKARAIRAALLDIVADRGEADLEFLRDLSDTEARAYLERLPGVGPKTAACVLAFALGMPALPVDTHVQRVGTRLGLIPPRVSVGAAQAQLEAQVPPPKRYAFHVLLIRHGRTICKAPRPLCERCPLENLCPKVGVVAGN